MGDKIKIPNIDIYKERGSDIKEIFRDRLCSTEECNGDTNECVECAFFSNENFDNFINQVGL